MLNQNLMIEALHLEKLGQWLKVLVFLLVLVSVIVGVLHRFDLMKYYLYFDLMTYLMYYLIYSFYPFTPEN